MSKKKLFLTNNSSGSQSIVAMPSLTSSATTAELPSKPVNQADKDGITRDEFFAILRKISQPKPKPDEEKNQT